MNEVISKIEDYIFDFLGLVLPGFIFLLLTSTPLLIYDYNRLGIQVVANSKLLSILKNLALHIDKIIDKPSQFTVIVIVLISYIIGHLIKVFSIIQYDFSRMIFDGLICKLFSLLDSWTRSYVKWILDSFFLPNDTVRLKLIKLLTRIYKPFNSLYKKLFQFEAPDFIKDNESLKDECISKINTKFNTQFPNKWYSLYKFSTVIQNQEGIKSTSFWLLAKYNLYRSLSFIFLITFAYYWIFFKTMCQYLDKSIISLQDLILWSIFLLWFTFHYKFKRYWTLCGNEVLVSLYYFLNK